MIQIKIKTWTCPECGYQQDFEPTKENMKKHFHLPYFSSIEKDECPACATGKNPSKIIKKEVKMVKETNSDKKIIMNIRDKDKEVEVEEKDENGDVILDSEGKLKLIKKIVKGLSPSEIQVIRDKYED